MRRRQLTVPGSVLVGPLRGSPGAGWVVGAAGRHRWRVKRARRGGRATGAWRFAGRESERCFALVLLACALTRSRRL